MVVTVPINSGSGKEVGGIYEVRRRTCDVALVHTDQSNLTAPFDVHIFNWFAIDQVAINLIIQWQYESRVDVLLA